MFRRKDVRAYTVTLTILSDLLAMQVAFLVAWWFRFHSGIMEVEDTPLFAHYFAMVTFWALLLVGIFHALDLYNIRMPLPFLSEVAKITQGLAISLAILFAVSFFLKAQFRFSRVTIIVMTSLAHIDLLFFRNILRKWWGQFLRKNDMLQRVLLVGVGEQSANLIDKIDADANSGRKVVGILFDEKTNDLPPQIPCLGRLSDLPAVLEKQEVDEVILGTIQVHHQQISDWILTCEQHLVQFRLVPDLFEILASRLQLDYISGVPLLGLGEFPLDRPFNRAVKRLLDIVGSLVGLTLSSLVYLVAGILIRIESKGPIFYTQERCGRDGEVFHMFKLRTMKTDAEAKTGPKWAEENDPRRTRIGTILRKYNLDETPQFWNVLRGDMSLVGPRPERPFFVEQFKDEIRHYMPRHSFKPGMTGWAQINGLRGNTPLAERVRYDLYYFENWSFWFDLRIMLATIFNFKNAY
jgi:exopolysaccharide biosynthesis polyprenyl glycosylphosphotransferase